MKHIYGKIIFLFQNTLKNVYMKMYTHRYIHYNIFKSKFNVFRIINIYNIYL